MIIPPGWGLEEERRWGEQAGPKALPPELVVSATPNQGFGKRVERRRAKSKAAARSRQQQRRRAKGR